MSQSTANLIQIQASPSSNGNTDVTIKNIDAKAHKIIEPILNYSIWIHFYNKEGEEIRPKRDVITDSINRGSLAVVDLGPGESQDVQISRSEIMTEYPDLKECRFISIAYLSDSYCLEQVGANDLKGLVRDCSYSNVLDW